MNLDNKTFQGPQKLQLKFEFLVEQVVCKWFLSNWFKDGIWWKKINVSSSSTQHDDAPVLQTSRHYDSEYDMTVALPVCHRLVTW